MDLRSVIWRSIGYFLEYDFNSSVQLGMEIVYIKFIAKVRVYTRTLCYIALKCNLIIIVL